MSTPTTQEISNNIIAAIAGEIGKQIPILPKSFTRVLAKGLAGVFVLLWKKANANLLNYFVDHASWDEIEINGRKLRPLVELGRLLGVGDPVAATNARLITQFNVENPDGTVLQPGRQLVHPSSGVIYILEDAVTLDGNPKIANVIAASDPDGNGGAGTIGNRQVGETLEWANRPPQVAAAGATVAAILQTAADAENEDAYRERVREAARNRPQGGAYADYRIWGTEDPGIVAIYPYTGEVPGTVEVYVEASEASSGNEDGIPTTDQIDLVYGLIEADSAGLATRRPVSAFIFVEPISRQPFNVTVNNLDVSNASADATTVRAAIEEALDDFLLAREPYVEGLSPLPRTDRVTESAVAASAFEAADSFGASIATVDVLIGSGSFGAYTLGKGQKAKLGSVLFL